MPEKTNLHLREPVLLLALLGEALKLGEFPPGDLYAPFEVVEEHIEFEQLVFVFVHALFIRVSIILILGARGDRLVLVVYIFMIYIHHHLVRGRRIRKVIFDLEVAGLSNSLEAALEIIPRLQQVRVGSSALVPALKEAVQLFKGVSLHFRLEFFMEEVEELLVDKDAGEIQLKQLVEGVPVALVLQAFEERVQHLQLILVDALLPREAGLDLAEQGFVLPRQRRGRDLEGLFRLGCLVCLLAL
uniref:Uncharacterized protein n=1 Tax=Strombidium inclinatum TaxID=197538 RepID=A0A7S3MWS5_9SPIT|mmetsp:Transcript_23968/g.36746  ORF Transcript_23968/g.36746 Transcript_23968/m.36746 type:complete len:244 (+) Transcript_23968:2214-2945(+)